MHSSLRSKSSSHWFGARWRPIFAKQQTPPTRYHQHISKWNRFMGCVFFGAFRGSGWRSDSLPYSFVYQDDAKSSESSGRVHRCLQAIAGPASFWSSPDCIWRRRKVRHSVVVRNFWLNKPRFLLECCFKGLRVRSIVLRLQPCSYFGCSSSTSQESAQGIPFFALPKCVSEVVHVQEKLTNEAHFCHGRILEDQEGNDEMDSQVDQLSQDRDRTTSGDTGIPVCQ